jgi:hypothetical protein
MKLNEYIEYIRNPLSEAKPRVVIVNPGEDLTSLHRFLKENGSVELFLSNLVKEDAWLPMPSEVFERINKTVQTQVAGNAPLVLLGLPGYLALLTNENKRVAIFALREWVDSTTGREAVCILHDDTGINLIIKDIFSNPRYRQGKQLLTIKTDLDEPRFATTQMGVVIVGANLTSLIPGECYSFQQYLQHVEDHPNDDLVRRIVVASEKKLPGLSAEVQQLINLQDFAHVIYGVNDIGLSENALRWMCELAQKEGLGITLSEIFKPLFFPEGKITSRVLCVFDKRHGIEREVVLWLIKQVTPKGSYLEYIIGKDEISSDNFRSAYITGAIECLDRYDEYATERKDAILDADIKMSDADIRVFISRCSKESTSQVVPWLNCGTRIEQTEMLRRIFDDGIVSNAIKAVYPEASAYLNSALVFEESPLYEYFAEYRELKITNRVTPEFCEKARSGRHWSSVQSRDMIVQKYVTDDSCALLVVDAMGVEWLPMLIALAQERNLGVESLTLGEAHLPTTTEFNCIHWPASERRLPDIKRFDNIVHNGAEAHETRSAQENLAAALDVIGSEVIPRVAQGLIQFERVLVTADHGSSRLSVLARQAEPILTRTLTCEADAEIADWRYRKRAAQGGCPPELEETLDGQYWVVRGYDRLPKKGGGQSFELHGGATLEERLVPVVVFSKRGQFVPKTKIAGERAQIVEKDDFDL